MFTHKPQRRFGQNFLIDPAVIQDLISQIAPSSKDAILEIGPGHGALSIPLSHYAGSLRLIELDRNLAQNLQAIFRTAEHVFVEQADALQYPFSERGAIRVVGNLPYNIATQLIFRCLLCNNIQDMHFMVQQEVAERITAAPGSKKYGRLTVMVQYHCVTDFLLQVPPAAFQPEPKVQSAVVALIPQAPQLAAIDYQHFANLVNLAFQQRRKILQNTLQKLATTADIEAAHLSPMVRAENLTVQDFVRLSNFLVAKQND